MFYFGTNTQPAGRGWLFYFRLIHFEAFCLYVSQFLLVTSYDTWGTITIAFRVDNTKVFYMTIPCLSKV